MAVLVTLFLGSLIGLLYFYGQKKDPKPIFGIYTQAGKWYPLKYILFLCMYYYRKFTAKDYILDPKSVYTKVRAGHGRKAISDPVQHDRAQPLSDHPLAFDAVFFIGSNSDGYYAIAGCERRQMGVCHGLFYIAIPGKGLLCSKKIPDTILFGAEPNQFGCEGLLIKPVEPMKKWSVAYEGEMWFQSDPEKKIQVHFESEWIAKWKCFDYDSDLYAPAIARSIARETWHRGYFEDLKKAHQSHIDQFGVWNTKFEFEGEKYSIELQGFRDHSFGHKRDWTLMHRYAFHHIFLENGLSASVGVVCQPSTATEFELGAVCLPNGGVYPVKWCDLKLYQHGENGSTPHDYAYRFQAADEIYTVQVEVVYETIHYVTPNWDARMVERFVKYTVNGVPGRGVSEFHYNHTGGRPDKYAADDPEWFKKISTRH